MKIRTGFVSNSSSSSFVCNVCGRQESGWDMGINEAEMVQCEHGHTFCVDELVVPIPEKFTDEDSEHFNEDMVYGYGVPEVCCPVCTFAVYAESDMVAYLKKKYGDDTDEAFTEVKTVNSRRKKLYDSEYVFHSCKKHNTTVDAEFNEIKTKFTVYSKFNEFLKAR